MSSNSSALAEIQNNPKERAISRNTMEKYVLMRH